MKKTIICPTDFSNSSLNAAFYAAGLARYMQASLLLVNVMPFPIAVSEISLPAESIDDLMNRGYKDLQELKSQLKIATEEAVNIRVILKMGSVENQLEELTLEEQPLALVLGLHSEKSLERALMGSTLFHVMNHIPFPAFVIPEHAEFQPINKIGIACDLKKSGHCLPVESIKTWLSVFGANPDIIHIGTGTGDFKADQLAESISIQNQLAGFKPSFHFLINENLEEELNQYEKENRLDLLMLFPRKHGISDIFRKKHAGKMAIHSKVPILSIHELPVNVTS